MVRKAGKKRVQTIKISKKASPISPKYTLFLTGRRKPEKRSSKGVCWCFIKFTQTHILVTAILTTYQNYSPEDVV